jgi:hypothetical protein
VAQVSISGPSTPAILKKRASAIIRMLSSTSRSSPPLAARGPATTSARHARWSTTFSTDNRTRIFAAWRRSSPRSNLGAFDHANGLTDDVPGAHYALGISPSLDDLRDHASRITMLSAVPDLLPLSWLETLQRVVALPTLEPIEWFIAAVAMANDLGWPLTHELHGAIGRAYLDRLVSVSWRPQTMLLAQSADLLAASNSRA